MKLHQKNGLMIYKRTDMTQITKIEIDNFWNWFTSVSNSFGDQFENEDLVNELDQKIRLLGDIAWEIGPGVIDPNNNALVFSPCGNKDLLPLTRLIVENAPDYFGWEFYSSKPPKKWKRYFLMRDDKGNDITINAANWRYSLLKYQDGKFDIIILAPELSKYSENFKNIAAAIVLDGEIGEENRINWIDTIEVVDKFANNLSEKSSPINLLLDHFNYLKNSGG
jgi:hypothetical protein